MAGRPRSRRAQAGAAAAIALGLAYALACGACSPHDGPLLVRRSQADAAISDGPVRAGATLQYQITGSLDRSVDAELYVTDLFDTAREDIDALHGSGRVVLAYTSVGSFEPWRDDADSFPASAIGQPLAAYPEESWLDVRDARVRQAIGARFDRARSKGFDGVYASTVGAYAQTSGFPLTRNDELDYDRFVAQAAHERGLSPGLSGDFELGSDVETQFDWALAIGCFARNSCGQLAVFQNAGKPVFDLETEGVHADVCAITASLALPTTFKHEAYDAWRSPCS